MWDTGSGSWPESASASCLARCKKSPPMMVCHSNSSPPASRPPAYLSSLPPALRKGSRLFSLCLSSRKWSGLDGRAQCLDTDVAEPGLGPGPIVLYLATTGGYFCFCCLILSDIVSVPSRGRCVCAPVCVCVCFPAYSLDNICGALRPWSKGNRRPSISIEIVRSNSDKDCFLFWRLALHTEPQTCLMQALLLLLLL